MQVTFPYQNCDLLLQMAAAHENETFLDMFGTPTLLWRVLSSVGYEEPPKYTWREAENVGSLPWMDVQITVPACPNNPEVVRLDSGV